MDNRNISGRKSTSRCKVCAKRMFNRRAKRKNERYYQYTAIDEYTRLRYTWFTNAHDTYASSEFAKDW